MVEERRLVRGWGEELRGRVLLVLEVKVHAGAVTGHEVGQVGDGDLGVLGSGAHVVGVEEVFGNFGWDGIDEVAKLFGAVGETTLFVELAKTSLLVVLAQLGLVIAMRRAQLPLLLLEILRQRVVHMSQLGAAVRKRAQGPQRALLRLFKVPAQAGLVLLVVHYSLLVASLRRFLLNIGLAEAFRTLVLVRMLPLLMGHKHRRCLPGNIIREDGRIEGRLVRVLDFARLRVENRHCQDGDHDGHILRLLMELLLVVGFLRFARRVVGVRWGVLEDGLLFKLRLQH